MCNIVWFLIILFESLYIYYAALTYSDKQKHHFLCHHQFTILILRKFGFKVCVISFGFYSTNFKVDIHLPCINTQRQTKAPFDITPVISSSDLRMTGLYQGSANSCEGYCNSDIICLLQPSKKIHYCNQSLLVIVLDLNIFVFSITIFDLIFRSALLRFFLLRGSYLYKSMGIRFYIFGSLPASRLCDRHCHGWVHYIVTTKIRF